MIELHHLMWVALGVIGGVVISVTSGAVLEWYLNRRDRRRLGR